MQRRWLSRVVLIGFGLGLCVACADASDTAADRQGAWSPDQTATAGATAPPWGSGPTQDMAAAGHGGGDATGSGAADDGAGGDGALPASGDHPAGPNPPPTSSSDSSAPEDGDPNAPVVAIPGISCGANSSLLGLTSTNASIGGRDVHVAYPCNKRQGAPMTFILNLHGTMPNESLKLYQVAYFAVNEYVDSHNIITVAPKSVVSQWGNGDNGQDEPHLIQVIDWVYSTFSDFDIRSMWVGGHSWGAMFTSRFGCRQDLADKVDGLILMSTTQQMPSCASRVSIINTNAEDDISGPLNQGSTPSQHGCGSPMTSQLGNNTETLWPNCDEPYVHANYLMHGKAHADYIDAVVVERIADLIRSTRR